MQNDMFKRLRWENLEQEHGEHWAALRGTYGFTVKQLSAPGSLDDLAQQCIHLCREHLFSSWLSRYQWAGNREIPAGWRPWDPDDILSMNNLEQALTPALCDHLIITFAHQFYCDNLEPKRLRDGLDEIFACRTPSYQDRGIQDKVTNVTFKNERKQFKDNFTSKINTYSQSILKIIDTYRFLMCCNSQELDCLDNLKDRMDRALSYMQENNTSLTEEYKEMSAKSTKWLDCRIAAPDWLFTFVMADNWTRSPFKVNNSKGTSNSIPALDEAGMWSTMLYNFIAKGASFRLLLKEQNESVAKNYQPFQPYSHDSRASCSRVDKTFHISFEESKESPDPSCRLNEQGDNSERDKYIKTLSGTFSVMELRTEKISGCRFAAIACGIDKTYKCPLPAQQYPIKSSGKPIEISSDLQYVFNNYLLERNFHEYALCTASDCIRTFFANYRFDSQKNLYYKSLFHQLPIILRLNASLVHAPLIELMGQIIWQSASDDQHQCPNFLWLNQYIDYWNAVALPILEELFLWGVHKFYTSFNQIRAAIEACVLDNSYGILRCDRLNLYRIIPQSQDSHVEQLTKTYHSFVDPIGECGYLSKAGFKITSDGMGYQIDMESCTAFGNDMI